MHKFILTINSLIAFFASCSFGYASMIMTQDELSTIESLLPDNDSSGKAQDENKFPQVASHLPDILYLSAILYFQPKHWTVWINDKIYTAENNEDDILKLVNVTEQSVKIEFKDLKNQVKVCANQSFITLEKRIVDGDARIKHHPPHL